MAKRGTAAETQRSAAADTMLVLQRQLHALARAIKRTHADGSRASACVRCKGTGMRIRSAAGWHSDDIRTICDLCSGTGINVIRSKKERNDGTA